MLINKSQLNTKGVNSKVNFQKMLIPLFMIYSKFFRDFAEGCIDTLNNEFVAPMA